MLCVALFLAWILRSEFVQKMIEESGFMLIDKIVTNPAMVYDNIKAPLWVFVGAILDFAGASVVAKLFYCDLLLDIVIKTELQDVTPQQDVMRGEVERLKEPSKVQAVMANPAVQKLGKSATSNKVSPDLEIQALS